MTRIITKAILVALLTLSAFGCGDDDITDPCGGEKTLTGFYSSSSPAMTMDIVQCGPEVTGTLNYAGRDYVLNGEVKNGEFRFTTQPVDLCGTTTNSKRSVSSQSTAPFEIMKDGDEFVGAARVADAFCSNNRTRIQGLGIMTFVRR